MAKVRRVKMIIEKTSTGYSAYSDKHSIFTTGRTKKELHANWKEAKKLYFKK